MYRFYDEDANGKWHKHNFDKEEAGIGFIIFLLLGFIIPIIIAVCNI